MPASSKRQRRTACAALSAKEGKRPKSELKGPAKRMAENMSKEQLKHYCEEPVKKSKKRK